MFVRTFDINFALSFTELARQQTGGGKSIATVNQLVICVTKCRVLHSQLVRGLII